MLIRSVVVPLIACIGIFSAVSVAKKGALEPPKVEPYLQPSTSPFKEWIAGTGTIEPLDEAKELSLPVGGVVEKLLVEDGQEIKAGEELLSLETDELKAELDVAKARLTVLSANVQRARRLFDFYSSVTDKRAISKEVLLNRESELTVAKAEYAEGEAKVQQLLTEVDRRILRSPIDGIVLQKSTRVGEYAQAGQSGGVITVGKVDELQVRVQVDETESHRVRPNAPAMLALRGASDIKSELKFIRIEPQIVPKQTLTGESIERVDTRVLELIYKFKPLSMPIYPGQLVDVFVEADK